MESCRIRVNGYFSCEKPPAPYVTVEVLNPTRRRSARIEAKIDTGFSGDILLSFTEYTKLGLQLFEKGREAVGRVASGYLIKLRVSHGFLKIGNLVFKCKIYTSLLSSMNLLGRGILNKARVLLDSPENFVEICFREGFDGYYSARCFSSSG